MQRSQAPVPTLKDGMRHASPLGGRGFDCPPGIATTLQRGALFSNFPLTESGLPVGSAEGAG
jgi:hypothetical protein